MIFFNFFFCLFRKIILFSLSARFLQTTQNLIKLVFFAIADSVMCRLNMRAPIEFSQFIWSLFTATLCLNNNDPILIDITYDMTFFIAYWNFGYILSFLLLLLVSIRPNFRLIQFATPECHGSHKLIYHLMC